MDKKLAVAMFGQKRLSREGGVEIVVKELCTRMARDGYEVTCFNRGGHHVSGAEYDQAVEYKGVRQKTVPTIDAKGLAAVSSSGFAALFIGYQGSAVLDEPEQKTDTISVPIPQCEESENIPLSDFPEQPENVQRPGSEVVEKGMLT